MSMKHLTCTSAAMSSVLLAIAMSLSGCNEGDGATGADEDGDGLSDREEVSVWGTSPTLADTDGDGFDDGQEVTALAFDREVNNFRFNPLVADRPEIEIRLAGPPAIYVDYTTSEGTSRRIGTEHSNTASRSSSQTWGGSKSTTVEMTHTVGAEASFSPTSFGGSLSYEFSHSTATETSSSWSQEQTRENSRTLAEMREFESSHEVSNEGGVLAVTVVIRNPGSIAYHLDNLTLAAYEIDPGSPDQTHPIGQLTFGNGADLFPRTRVEPGQSSPPLSFDVELDLPTVQALLANSRNLMIRPATFEVAGDPGDKWPLAATTVGTRTMEVIIDYGFARPAESHLVSVMGTGPSAVTNVGDVFDRVLRTPYEQGVVDLRRKPEGRAEPTKPMLMSVRGYGTSDEENSMWYVVRSRVSEDGVTRRVEQYHPFVHELDFGGLDVRAGDILHLIRLIDADRDTLGERLEHALGTDPERRDSDGDGCEDGFEVNGWESEGVAYSSNPANPNTDGDAFDDCEEFANGTDPADLEAPDAWCTSAADRALLDQAPDCSHCETYRCLVDCYVEAGLSPECGECQDGWIECAYTDEDACAEACPEDGVVTARCAQCVRARCNPAYAACSGLPASDDFAGCDGEGTLCAEDERCIGLTGEDRSVCAKDCNPTRAGEGCAPDQVCMPLNSGRGACVDGCEPYPRAAGAYACDVPGYNCVPFVYPSQRHDVDAPVVGLCTPELGELPAWAACDPDGPVACADSAQCFDSDGSGARCHPICEPFVSGSCGAPDEVCFPAGPLQGVPALGVCLDNPQPQPLGSHACRQYGQSCAADNSICVDFDAGGDAHTTCHAVCRIGSSTDDCARSGGTCQATPHNAWGWSDGVPRYIGVCR